MRREGEKAKREGGLSTNSIYSVEGRRKKGKDKREMERWEARRESGREEGKEGTERGLPTSLAGLDEALQKGRK